MSPLPISRSALDRLGERLIASDEIDDADYEVLLRVLTAYQIALNEAQERLAGLGYAPTTRVKTTGVLIDKLRREGAMKLKGVQDIAGARIVADCDRAEQDVIVQRIVDEFADGSREPRVIDRRKTPSAGYRAVHVVVTVQDVPVEVQVRTWRQDQWAQIVEALGDKWGRGIRYGEDPPEPDAPLFDGEITRRDLWSAVTNVSDTIDQVERAWESVAALTQEVATFSPADHGSEVTRDGRTAALEFVRDAVTASEQSLRRVLSRLHGLADGLQ